MSESKIPDELKMQIYQDTLQPSVKSAGQTLSLIPRAIAVALSPIEKYIYTKECNLERTKKLIAEKMQDQPEDTIVPPEAYVAVPALHAISYSMESDVLRNLYANLLSKAMNIDSQQYVHPSFVEIIKQMSPVDAKVFDHIANTQYPGIIDLVSQSHYLENIKMYSAYDILETNISGLNIAPHQIQSASFDLLDRLGLIKIGNEGLTDNYAYTRIELSDEYKHLKSIHSAKENVASKSKSFYVTSLGKLFFKVCISDSILVEPV